MHGSPILAPHTAGIRLRSGRILNPYQTKANLTNLLRRAFKMEDKAWNNCTFGIDMPSFVTLSPPDPTSPHNMQAATEDDESKKKKRKKKKKKKMTQDGSDSERPPSLPSEDATLSETKARHKARKKIYKKKRRKEKRREEKDDNPRPTKRTKLDIQGRYVPLQTDFAPNDLNTPQGAYSGENHRKKELEERSKPYTLEELKQMGLKIIPWNGRTPRPLLDKDGRIFGCLVGQPQPEAGEYAEAAQQAYQLLLATIRRVEGLDANGNPVASNNGNQAASNGIDSTASNDGGNVGDSGSGSGRVWGRGKGRGRGRGSGRLRAARKTDGPHRRGDYTVDEKGASHGGGQTRPKLLAEGVIGHGRRAEAITEVLQDPKIQRIERFASFSMGVFAPRLRTHYSHHMNRLAKLCPELWPNCRGRAPSIFACSAVNWPAANRFGKSVWTWKHRDVRNLAYGLCAITALGEFDPTKGGHLILWDLNIAIEFPPGATILIPSAILLHSNVPVQDGENRASLTFYTAGGLFRWVNNDGYTDKELKKRDPKKFEDIKRGRPQRWMEGLSLWSTLEEIFSNDPVVDPNASV